MGTGFLKQLSITKKNIIFKKLINIIFNSKILSLVIKF